MITINIEIKQIAKNVVDVAIHTNGAKKATQREKTMATAVQVAMREGMTQAATAVRSLPPEGSNPANN